MNDTGGFKIVLLHDDLVSGIRGSSVVERLAGQLEMESNQLETDFWKFTALRDPSLRVQAISLLRQANMIIISVTGGADLPGHVKEIIEQSLHLRPDREAAIVALLDGELAPSRDLPRPGIYLRDLAAKTGLDFFCNKRDWQPHVGAIRDSAPANNESRFATARETTPRNA